MWWWHSAVLAAVVATGAVAWGDKDKVLLEKVTAVTLREGQLTAGRRSAGVPQIACRSSTDLCRYAPRTMRCVNQGFDGTDVQWSCTADLDSDVRFVSTDVSCEGYEYPDDPYILRNSCGVEIELEFVRGASGRSRGGHDYRDHQSYQYSSDSEGSSFVGILIVAGLVAFTLYYCVPSTNRGRRGSSRGSGGFGGGSWGGGPGGGDNGGDVGPPPGSGDCPPSGRQVPPQSQQQSGPGFWSGFGTGGVMGYMFGNNGGGYNNNGGNYNGGYNNRGWFGRRNNGGWFGGNNSWFGGGRNRGYGYNSGAYDRPQRTRVTTTTTASASSSGSRTATGYGTTRRR